MWEAGGQEMSRSYGKGLRYNPILREILCVNMIFYPCQQILKRSQERKKMCMAHRGYALVPQKQQSSFCHLTLIL